MTKLIGNTKLIHRKADATGGDSPDWPAFCAALLLTPIVLAGIGGFGWLGSPWLVVYGAAWFGTPLFIICGTPFFAWTARIWHREETPFVALHFAVSGLLAYIAMTLVFSLAALLKGGSALTSKGGLLIVFGFFFAPIFGLIFGLFYQAIARHRPRS